MNKKDIKKYLDSGILELYALEVLSEQEAKVVENMLAKHIELGEELEKIYVALERYAQAMAIDPSPDLKDRIIQTFDQLQLEKEAKPPVFPLINKDSDYRQWIEMVKNLLDSPLGADGRAIQILRNDEKVTQLLITSTTDIEQEVHENEYESFLILEGSCKCTINKQVNVMYAGDFMSIPLYQAHDVQLITPKVTAILQHIRP